MADVQTKHPGKMLIVEKGKRPQRTTTATMPVTNSAAHDAVVSKNSAVLPDGAHNVDSHAARPASFIGISPGKNLAPKASIEYYAGQIDQNWQRGVNAFMTIGRLCADANAELSVKGKRELIKQLQFGASAFSKFVQIGTDTRLNTPEIRRLLPPHYTITYAITTLTDQEFQDAIVAKVIYPDMKRTELQKWRKSRREPSAKVDHASSATQVANDSAVVTPRVLQEALHRERSIGNTDGQTGSDARSSDVAQSPASNEAACPSTPPPGDDLDIPAFLDRCRPSPDERAFDLIKTAWNSHVQKLWSSASPVVRERFLTFLRAKTPSR